MDNYKKDNPKSGEAKPQPPAEQAAPAVRPATANIADSFRSSGTGSLAKGATRRLAPSAIDTERAIESMRTEIENGKLITSKLEGRIAVLYRGVKIVEKPIDVNTICQGISAGEANFTKQVAKMLQADAHTTRRVQVALYQWDQAKIGLAQAEESLERALQFEGTARMQYVDSSLHVEKLRGQLYPLINLHVVFRDNALIAQLIPTPKIQVDPPPPPPPPVAQPAPTGPTGTGGLRGTGKLPGLPGLPGLLGLTGTGKLPTASPAATPAAPAAEPSGTGKLTTELVSAETTGQVAAALKQATGSLRNALLGMLGGVPKEDTDKK